MTELRVNPWRVSMIDAVTRAYGGGDDLFQINPGGVEGSADFSFLVIGDPGEGDASQYSLISRYLELGLRDDVKFLVISSDVIYPAGSMHDYEANFYLPFQGFAKPIYAIPGNHDWYDALEGFNANFLEAKAARAAIEARVAADVGLTSTNARRIDKLMAEAARMRQLYGVKVGTQRAAFFELQTDDFALLAIDTGILRTVDERQWAWIERALSFKGHTSDTRRPISQVIDFKILPGMGDHPTSVMVRALLLAILTVDHIDYLIRRYAIGYWLRIPLR
jgi:hypothetical protein